MKKKLLVCISLLCLVQIASALKPGSNVASTYLTNFTAPYTGTGVFLDGGTRFQQIAAPWVLEGAIGTMGTAGCTAWHIDGNKGGAITLTAGWDGFAASFENMKVYQSVTLPAGTYDFKTSSPSDKSANAATYIVVDDAIGLPTIANLSTALAYSKASESMTVHFTLAAETKISFGMVASFGDNLCMTIGSWELINYVEGVNYSLLNAILTTAKGMDAANYPLGTTSGKYSSVKWAALQLAITNADAFVALGETGTQPAVDAHTASLTTAVAELKASQLSPISFSDATTSYWYQLHDNRGTNVYWEVGTVGTYTSAIFRSTTSDSSLDKQLFKFVKAPAPATGFYIYSKTAPAIACGGDTENNVVTIDAAISPISWVYANSPVVNYYIISTESNGTQLNSHGDRVGFYNDATDAGNQWAFDFVSEVPTSVDKTIAISFGVYVSNRMILSTDPSLQFQVYTLNGQKVNADQQLAPGIYIVKANQQTQKVIVK